MAVVMAAVTVVVVVVEASPESSQASWSRDCSPRAAVTSLRNLRTTTVDNNSHPISLVVWLDLSWEV